MKSIDEYWCNECAVKKRRTESRRFPLCFRVDASKAEDSLGHQVYQCELCGARYKLTPAMFPQGNDSR